MKVTLSAHPKYPKGLVIKFPYSSYSVDTIKQVLGTNWNPKGKYWEAVGPEILLDFPRFGIEVEHITPAALKVAEEFRQQVWNSLDSRVLPIDDEQFGYQKQGSDFLVAMPGSILGDDMGTGKSKQSLDAGAIQGYRRILIVCNKTAAYNWENEVRKWHPELTVGVVSDGGPSKRKLFWSNRPDVVIATYEKLWQPDWPFSLEWDVFIPDEATRFKNKKTQTWKAVSRIANHSKTTWPLTGTPLEKKIDDLYSIMSAIRPAVLGNFSRFREQHMELDPWSGKVIGVKSLDLLRARIGPFLLRRTKGEVMKWLPPKQFQELYVDLSVDERKAYEAFTDEFNNWLTDHGVSGGNDPMIQTVRMRQFCCTPMLFTNDLGRGSKYEALEDKLDEYEGKVVIFCFFKEVITLLQKWLGTHPEALITGDVTSSQERYRRSVAFNEGKLGNIFLSTDAGNQSINLPGAELVIHYDQIFNPQKMHQREDRLHRPGQQGHVHVLSLLCKGTIDEGMFQNNREEESTFEQVINGAEQYMLRKLNAARWKAMIEGKLDG